MVHFIILLKKTGADMHVLDSYSFGRLSIDGKPFTQDCIIFPDGRILCPWWRKQGHRIEIVDLEELINMQPDTIVAGTGYSGLMQPTEDLSRLLVDKSIQFIAEPTGEAIQTYNKLSSSNNTGACFHLTC